MKSSDSVLIKNGRVIDPANNIDETLDVLIIDGIFECVGHITEPFDGTTDLFLPLVR